MIIVWFFLFSGISLSFDTSFSLSSRWSGFHEPSLLDIRGDNFIINGVKSMVSTDAERNH
jgi:hypothetical protein